MLNHELQSCELYYWNGLNVPTFPPSFPIDMRDGFLQKIFRKDKTENTADFGSLFRKNETSLPKGTT